MASSKLSGLRRISNSHTRLICVNFPCLESPSFKFCLTFTMSDDAVSHSTCRVTRSMIKKEPSAEPDTGRPQILSHQHPASPRSPPQNSASSKNPSPQTSTPSWSPQFYGTAPAAAKHDPSLTNSSPDTPRRMILLQHPLRISQILFGLSGCTIHARHGSLHLLRHGSNIHHVGQDGTGSYTIR
jgi:hypothetical protein